MRRIVVPLSSLALLAGCIPERDNANDPSLRPRPRFEIRVDGAPQTAGGRHASWELDASESRAPGGIDEIVWEISGAAAVDPDEVAEWLPVGTSTLVTTSSSEALRTELSSIDDFGEDGTGTTERWLRLTVVSDAGYRESAETEIAILNGAPSVELGFDRRISPGGRWWTALGGAALQPWEIVIAPVVSDPDTGDAALPFTAGFEGEWRVRGALAARLDADADGLVDGDFVEAGGARLRFTAPVEPASGEISLEIWDLVRDGVRASLASDSVRIDVAASAWIHDRADGGLYRIPDPPLLRNPGTDGRYRLLGGDGSRVLLARQAADDTWTIFESDPTLLPLASLPLADTSFAGPRSAAGDGRGGWWVIDSESDLIHLRKSGDGSELVAFLGATECPPDPYASCAIATRSGSGFFREVAPAWPDSTGVWALAYDEPSFTHDRILLIATDGTATIEESVFAAAMPINSANLLRADGDGGVWYAHATAPGVAPRLLHRDANGVDVDEAIPDAVMNENLPRDLVVDQRRDALFLLLEGHISAGGETLSPLRRRDADGTWTDHVTAISRRMAFAPGSRELVLDRYDVPGILIYDAETLELRRTVSSVPPADFEHLTVVASTVLADTLGSEAFSAHIDAGGRIQAETLALSEFGLLQGAVVDPATGHLFVFQTDCGCVERFDPSGVLVDTVDVAGGTAARGTIALDPETRMAWAAWTSSAGGGLASFAVLDDRAAPATQPVTIHEVDGTPLLLDETFDDLPVQLDLAVQPGGSAVCLAAKPAGAAGNVLGALYLPQQETLHPATPLSDLEVVGARSAAIDVTGGGCWFFSESLTVDATYLTPGGAESACDLGGVSASSIAMTPRPDDGGKLFAALGVFDADPWFGTCSEGAAFDPVPGALELEPPVTNAPLRRKTLSMNPYFRYLTVGLSFDAAAPMLVWVDEEGRELSRSSAFLDPAPVRVAP